MHDSKGLERDIPSQHVGNSHDRLLIDVLVKVCTSYFKSLKRDVAPRCINYGHDRRHAKQAKRSCNHRPAAFASQLVPRLRLSRRSILRTSWRLREVDQHALWQAVSEHSINLFFFGRVSRFWNNIAGAVRLTPCASQVSVLGASCSSAIISASSFAG